jgi:hypothetical protein
MLDSDQQSDSSSTISDNATESSKPTSTTNRMLPPIGQKPSLQTGGSSNNQPTGQKRSLMSDLRKLREQKVSPQYFSSNAHFIFKEQQQTSKVDGHSPRQSAASKLLYPEPEESHGPVSRLCRHPQHKRAELTSTGAFRYIFYFTLTLL